MTVELDGQAPAFRDVLDVLTHAEIVESATWAVKGVAVERRRHRNVSFLVEVGGGSSYFIKQMHPRAGLTGVGREALVHAALLRSGSPLLSRALPTLLWQSKSGGTLVYAVTEGDVPMTEQVRSGRPSQRLARNLGSTLADLHRMPPPPYEAQFPHGLVLHRPTLSDLPSRSGANLELVRRIQEHGQLLADLDEAAASWRADAFVHADMKFDNILSRRSADGRRRGTCIIDWEDAGAGDARWDVGAVFGAYLATWLTSIPSIQVESPSHLFPLAKVEREALLPSVEAFWQSYAARRRLMPDESREFLRGAVQYAGVRLIQAASEGTGSTPLTAVHLFLLQVGANMLARPDDALSQLLGIGAGSVAPS
ncbi:phosphotransferase family protein [Nocardioides sp. URHA0020]|uniref:phosphotransferase family protein n=1 Tax=Nocardioides sp. URHA0020 TaxID=1380392 RepID=UPI00048D6B19|nr:aminoglycoside phosphotransferase family protein [Nocardioides sp. URHA0020]